MKVIDNTSLEIIFNNLLLLFIKGKKKEKERTPD